MVVICPVCIDPLVVSTDIQIVSPTCGHVFHGTCLTNWLAEKSTCPTCRTKIKQDKIKRLYLESTIVSGQSEDVASYVCQVDSMTFELKLKQKEIADYKEKAIQDEVKKRALRAEVSKLEIKMRKIKTDYSDAFNAQQSMLREMRSLKECLKDMDKLKQDLEGYKRLDTILFGSVETADSVLKSSDVDRDNLIMLVSSFKNAFEEAKQSVTKKDKIIQRLTSENISYKTKVEDLSSQISTLERVRDTYRKKLSDMNSSVCSAATDPETSTYEYVQLTPEPKSGTAPCSSRTPDLPSPHLPSFKHPKLSSLKRKPDSSTPMLSHKIKIVSSRLKRPQTHS